MKKIYPVVLGEAEQAELRALVSKGRTSARKVTRARILLLAHAGGKDAASAPKRWNTSLPPGVVVSICSPQAARSPVVSGRVIPATSRQRPAGRPSTERARTGADWLVRRAKGRLVGNNLAAECQIRC